MWDIFGCHENILEAKCEGWTWHHQAPSNSSEFSSSHSQNENQKKTTCLATMYICDLHWLSEWYLMSDCHVVAMLKLIDINSSNWMQFVPIGSIPGELLHRLAACPNVLLWGSMHRKFEDVPTIRSVPTKESCKYCETWMPMPLLSFLQVTGLTHDQVCSSHESFSMGFGSGNNFPW